MLNQGTDFGHDGRTVICHTEAEEEIWTHGVPEGRVVFWINDYEVGTPQYAHLSARTAWSMARYMRENSAETKITMLYNRNMALPLSAGERKKSRELAGRLDPLRSRAASDGSIRFRHLLRRQGPHRI